jgi:hypothetical protein
MKKLILLAILAAIVSGCGTDEPQTVDRRPGYRPEKAPPSVSSQKAEDFRAIERPPTYSE